MMDFWIWLPLLVPVVLIGAVLLKVARRARDFQKLLEDGVATRGTITRKFRFGTTAHQRRRTQYLEYRYQDSRGDTHTQRSNVPSSVWDTYEEGGSIEVVYSESHPAVSAPRYLVDLAKQGVARKA